MSKRSEIFAQLEASQERVKQAQNKLLMLADETLADLEDAFHNHAHTIHGPTTMLRLKQARHAIAKVIESNSGDLT